MVAKKGGKGRGRIFFPIDSRSSRKILRHRNARFRIRSPDIADKLSIALISHARNAARYALQLVERVHASGISLAFRNGSVFLSDTILENVRVYPSIPPLDPYNSNGIAPPCFVLVRRNFAASTLYVRSKDSQKLRKMLRESRYK